MARRSPGEIRAERSRRLPAGRRLVIDGLCAATTHEIVRFEVRHQLPAGHVARAFGAWALALHEWPGQGANHGSGTTCWKDLHARTPSEYPELALGEPFGVERRPLDAYGITGKPEDLAPDSDPAGDWAATWGDCWATTVAEESSIDPTTAAADTASISSMLVAAAPPFE